MTDPATIAAKLTKAQHHILRHSLGLNYGRKEYRNHFVTGEGSDDYPNCMALVKMGLMSHRKGNELSGGDDVFFVTNEGKKIARRAYLENEQ